MYRLAAGFELKGYVCNEMDRVAIEVEGTGAQLQAFTEALLHETKEPAKIHTISTTSLIPIGYEQFTIRASENNGAAACTFPPDLSVCKSCLLEIQNPAHRLFRYPFTSCTDCGPRFSIICDLPYDRAYTAMQPFPLCASCEAEYNNPANRRFHAQTLGCPACGPLVELRDRDHVLVRGEWRTVVQDSLLRGDIVAVKGLGGFHLLCDAAQPQAIEKLRLRKRRVRKPFALLAADISIVSQCFHVSPEEQRLLVGEKAPIVLLQPTSLLETYVSTAHLACGYTRMGVMLPYTPLHALLLSDALPFLVATSANLHGHPIVKTNEQAAVQLHDIADLFVYHPRDIQARVEDSVCQVVDEEIQLIRRSRGYVPQSIDIPKPPDSTGEVSILAIGAEQKNTVCLLRQQAVLSQHFGEIENEEQVAVWKEEVHHMTRLLRMDPDIVAYDPHPGFRISKEIRTVKPEAVLIPVYHHHAHMAACMAEHGLDIPVIGCILDGTGYGRDGTLWGFEILTGDYIDFSRVCSLEAIPLPGGEAAIRRPWMQAVSLHYHYTQDAECTRRWAEACFPAFKESIPLVLAQLQGKIPVPRTTSAGRLFDGVSAILNVCLESSYEGEAAILLGEEADQPGQSTLHEARYSVQLKAGQFLLRPLIQELIWDVQQSVPVRTIARTFHHTIARMLYEGARLAREETGCSTVVFGGGVWNNRYLLSYARRLLTKEGFTVYTPQRIPAGDGGIALGQAVSALWRWHQHVSIGTGQSSRSV